MEYTMIVGFVFLLLLTIIAVAYSQSAVFAREVSQAQTQKIARQIVDAADSVSYAGPPSKKTLTLYFPDDLRQVQFEENTITFVGSGDGGVYEYMLVASTNLSGNITPFPGIHRVSVKAMGGYVNISG